ncbi:class I tRNA ligase family protein [Curtobacterium flaccumfaciens]|uniref:class I tRNA ligase family protein n=1 Tax=Curtobacterium flaccumfaciens TaxID=2035 RepID=UPI003556EDAE
MSATHFVTVPAASAHSFDHLGFALDLVTAGVICALEDTKSDQVVVSATRDDDNIPSVRGAVSLDLDHFIQVSEAIIGRKLVSAGTRSAAMTQWAKTVWTELRRQEVLERGTFEKPWCSACQMYVEINGRRLSCPACGRREVHLRAEVNWFLRTSRYLQALREWRGEVTMLGPAADTARNAPVVPSRLSISRPAARTAGTGVRVPGDPSQVIHSGLVAACSYLLPRDATDWSTATTRTQVFGKGLVGLHTSIVPILCTALGLPTADRLHIHHHLTINGDSPQSAAQVGHTATHLLTTAGPDAFRWWLARLALTRRDASLALRDLNSLKRRELDSQRSTVPTAHLLEHFRARIGAAIEAVDIGRLTRGVLQLKRQPELMQTLTCDTQERLNTLTTWFTESRSDL